MREWVHIRDGKHDQCRSPDTSSILLVSVLPTRLLDIGQGSQADIVLVDAALENKCPKYAALCHCWGTEKVLTTTSVSLSAHRKGIPISNLPQTFQDMIFICKALSLQYVWIDSLCIIQDSELDWERESAKMGAIYKYAYVTIAASRAVGDTQGFLGSCSSSDLGEVHHVPCHEPVKGVVVSEYDGSSTRTARLFSPLSERAWVLQEHHLSRRTIFFTDRGLCWKCNTAELDESNHFSRLDPSENIWSKLSYAMRSLPEGGEGKHDLIHKASNLGTSCFTIIRNVRSPSVVTDFRHCPDWLLRLQPRYPISIVQKSGKILWFKDYRGIVPPKEKSKQLTTIKVPHGLGYLLTKQTSLSILRHMPVQSWKV